MHVAARESFGNAAGASMGVPGARQTHIWGFLVGVRFQGTVATRPITWDDPVLNLIFPE